MQVLFLNEDDVRQVLTMNIALDAVEQVLRDFAADEAHNIPRARCQTDQAMLHLLGGAAKKHGYLGYKSYVTSRQGAGFHVGLYDGQTGALVSLMQADYLGQMRTGAASGVATQCLARPEACELGIYGSGKQARTQLLAACKVRKIRRIQVYSPNEENRRRFAAEMTPLCQCDVEPVTKPELAAMDKDIVITATTSRTPVLQGEWLAAGTHLNVVGSNFLGKAEIDVPAVRRADTIVVDSKEQARLEAGDFKKALDEGILRWSDVRELGAVIVGRQTGRARTEDVTLFKSVGIGLEDVAVAGRVYAKAKEGRVGKLVEW